jgi:hypothetical protein
MTKKQVCVQCDGPLPASSGGRPRSYCGQVCRRSAEYELRSLRSQLVFAEKREMLARCKARTGIGLSDYIREKAAEESQFWALEAEKAAEFIAETLKRLNGDRQADSAPAALSVADDGASA